MITTANSLARWISIRPGRREAANVFNLGGGAPVCWTVFTWWYRLQKQLGEVRVVTETISIESNGMILLVQTCASPGPGQVHPLPIENWACSPFMAKHYGQITKHWPCFLNPVKRGTMLLSEVLQNRACQWPMFPGVKFATQWGQCGSTWSSQSACWVLDWKAPAISFNSFTWWAGGYFRRIWMVDNLHMGSKPFKVLRSV